MVRDLLDDDLAVARGQAFETALVARGDPPAEGPGPGQGQLSAAADASRCTSTVSPPTGSTSTE